jgi:hypothetical protein
VVSTRSVPRSCKLDKVGAMIQLWDIGQPVRTLAEDIVRIRCKKTASEDVGDLMCAAVNIDLYRICKPERLLYLRAMCISGQ